MRQRIPPLAACFSTCVQDLLCVLPHGRIEHQAVCLSKAKSNVRFVSRAVKDAGKNMIVVDLRNVKKSRLILVVEDIYETRAGIDTLLKANGYRVALAGVEGEAINSSRLERPDLILASGAGLPNNLLVKVSRMRKDAAVGDE